jgi:DNA-binding GntR family transcriptional regulator
MAKRDCRRTTPSSISSELYSDILERIIGGELAPGQRLVEEDLARKYGVSRTPIRDTLLALRKDGLVHQVRNRGATVAPFTASDVEEFYDIRKALEVFCIPALVRSGRWSDLIELQRRMLALEGKSGAEWRDAHAALDLDLHRAIVSSSNNQRLIHYMDTLTVLIGSMQVSSYRHDRSEAHVIESGRQHLCIVRALLDRDAQLAQQLLDENIEFGKRNAVELFLSIREGKSPISPTASVSGSLP